MYSGAVASYAFAGCRGQDARVTHLLRGTFALTHSTSTVRRAVTLPLMLALALVSLLGAFGAPTAEAAAPPAVVQPDSSTGMTADVLPTTQINAGGWVEDQVISGDTVYAGGKVTSARPAGAAAGTSESARGNLLAYSISTGNLTSFAPKLNGVVHVLALSPDKSRLYVGGEFTTVNGATRNRLVAIKTATGAVQTWAVNKTIKQYGTDGGVLSLKTDGTTVYGAGFWFGGTLSNYEGAWAANPSDGSIKWLADCHGDPYDTTVANGVVYAASHLTDPSDGLTAHAPSKFESVPPNQKPAP